MQWSRYNEFIQTSDKTFHLFNCRTKKWLNLVPELYKYLTESCTSPKDIKEIHPSLFNALLEHEFLTESIEEDISKCIEDISAELNNMKVLKLTINPTLDCNLRCWYCYENHLKGSEMNSVTMDAIIIFINKCFKQYNFESLQLSFFGGEPLLKFSKIIKPLLQKIKVFCNKNKVEFIVSFTTNGIFLNKKVRTEIQKYTDKICVQIPFDGDITTHDNVKVFPNGRGSYNIIKENARGAVIDSFNVSIRCNYTKENIQTFENVITDFKDLLSKPNLRFSFHKVWQEKDDDELTSSVTELKNKLKNLNFTSNLTSYFGESVNLCYGDYFNSYVINYNGDVFKCTARDFNKEHRIGQLAPNGEINFNEYAQRRICDSQTSDCFSCRRLPICPICSQVKSETPDGKCPVHITDEIINRNIKEYFIDLLTKAKRHENETF